MTSDIECDVKCHQDIALTQIIKITNVTSVNLFSKLLKRETKYIRLEKVQVFNVLKVDTLPGKSDEKFQQDLPSKNKIDFRIRDIRIIRIEVKYSNIMCRFPSKFLAFWWTDSLKFRSP